MRGGKQTAAVPGVELVDDALEANDGEEPRGEAGDPGEQEDGKGDEGIESSRVGQRRGLDLLDSRLLIGEEDLLPRRGRHRGGRGRRRRRGLARLHASSLFLTRGRLPLRRSVVLLGCAARTARSPWGPHLSLSASRRVGVSARKKAKQPDT